MSKYKTIPVSPEVFERVKALKHELGVRTYSELLNKLIDMFFQNKQVLIKKILCNDLRNSRLSLVALKNILVKQLGVVEADDVVAAMQYLRQTGEEEYVVDLSKCVD